MRNIGPCLCGDPECRSCFPVQPGDDVRETMIAESDAEEDPRERDEDDGSSYGDPRDEMDERMERD